MFRTIYRACFLVVAVCNPLQPLEKEEKLCELYFESNGYHCWKEYIKRCIECKSLNFYLPSGIQKQEADVLLNFYINAYFYLKSTLA